jgi:carbamoyl-phosphate synthase large subunit
MREAVKVSNESPVLLDRFLNDATEVDVDALSDGRQVLIGGIMEHIEQAGVHSGDSACSLPPYTLSQRNAGRAAPSRPRRWRKALNVVGLMNVQFAIQGDGRRVYVLEVNPRASRTVPFVSKATGLPLAKIAARCMAGRSLAEQGVDRRGRAAVLLGQGSGVPLHQVPRRRHHPRSRDEVDRRGDGRRPQRSPRPSSRARWPPA